MKPFVNSFGSMKLAYVLVVMILMVLPWMMIINPIPILLLIIVMILIMSLTKQKGTPFVIVSIVMCLPHLSGMKETGVGFDLLNYTIYLCIIIAFFSFGMSSQKHTLKKETIGHALLLLSVLALLFSLRFEWRAMQQWAYQILLVPAFFWTCYKSKENWDDVYYMVTIIFIIVSFYALMEFFLQRGPYVGIGFEDTSWESLFFRRAGGILGNSLVMLGMSIACHTVQIINYFKTGKISLLLVVYTLIVMLTTGSRTALYVTAAVWIMFLFYLNRGGKTKSRSIWIMLLAGILLFVVVEMMFHDYVAFYFDRFSEGNEHRTAAFETAFNIFRDNPFGVGRTGRDDALENYAAEGFIVSINTLDNTYLTFLVNEGIFCFIPFLFYFLIPINAFLRSSKNVEYKIVVMLFVPYVLCAMSFNIEGFYQLSVLYFGLAGHMYRIVQKREFLWIYQL